jgi:KDO2-lipid IV(A) lauroyltransferase
LGLDVVEIAENSLLCLRKLMSRLARNEIVCMPVAGIQGYKFVAVDVLGVEEYFPSGIASLARTSGAPLLPMFTFENEDGTDTVVIEEPICVAGDTEGDAALVECITKYARLLERYVRRYPAQWAWWHSRPMATRKNLPPTACVLRASGGRSQ